MYRKEYEMELSPNAKLKITGLDGTVELRLWTKDADLGWSSTPTGIYIDKIKIPELKAKLEKFCIPVELEEKEEVLVSSSFGGK